MRIFPFLFPRRFHCACASCFLALSMYYSPFSRGLGIYPFARRRTITDRKLLRQRTLVFHGEFRRRGNGGDLPRALFCGLLPIGLELYRPLPKLKTHPPNHPLPAPGLLPVHGSIFPLPTYAPQKNDGQLAFHLPTLCARCLLRAKFQSSFTVKTVLLSFCGIFAADECNVASGGKSVNTLRTSVRQL